MDTHLWVCVCVYIAANKYRTSWLTKESKERMDLQTEALPVDWIYIHIYMLSPCLSIDILTRETTIKEITYYRQPYL